MKTLIKHVILIVLVLMITTGTITAQEATVINFHKTKTGSLQDGWTNVTGKWVVKQEEQNMVLAQTAENSGSYYNVAIYNDADLKDVVMSVEIRANSGREDQGGGLVWRYTDIKNYYVVRFNPLENNYRFYKVQNGRRIQLATARVSVPKGSWFTVKVKMQGNKITCFLNGKKYLEKTDDTFSGSGHIGFWTKADAVSDFDNFQFQGE